MSVKKYRPKVCYYLNLWDPVINEEDGHFVGIKPDYEECVVCKTYESAIQYLSVFGKDYKSHTMKKCFMVEERKK